MARIAETPCYIGPAQWERPRSVRVQIVRTCIVVVHPIGPLLLQRNTEQSHTSCRVPHYLKEFPDIGAFLYVVSQVEMEIVELELAGSQRHTAENYQRCQDGRT